MQRKKLIIIFASLLVVCFSLYFFFSYSHQTKEIHIETSATNEAADSKEKSKPVEKAISDDTANEKDVKVEDVSINMTDKEGDVNEESDNLPTKSEGIKEKVRGVVEGVIKLFKKDQKVVAIGDSLTQGVGDETENGGYVGILNNTFQDNNINITIENYGKRGNRTDQLVKRLEKKEIAASIEKADIVFITIGANDIMHIVRNNITNLQIELFNEEKLEYLDRLRVIFHKINELNPDANIYLIGFYNPFDRYFSDLEELQIIVDEWNESSKAVTDEYENVRYIPTSDLFSDSDIELLADDYFHPNSSGYKLMAKRILENMEEVTVEQEDMNEDEE